jgi:hypothetical protein
MGKASIARKHQKHGRAVIAAQLEPLDARSPMTISSTRSFLHTHHPYTYPRIMEEIGIDLKLEVSYSPCCA